MTPTEYLEAQKLHITTQFKILLGTRTWVNVNFTDDDMIIVYADSQYWSMEIPSDDDGFYRFELIDRGNETGIVVSFPYKAA